jgi:uncharacterized protein YoaH (UPF0181 family)
MEEGVQPMTNGKPITPDQVYALRAQAAQDAVNVINKLIARKMTSGGVVDIGKTEFTKTFVGEANLNMESFKDDTMFEDAISMYSKFGWYVVHNDVDANGLTQYRLMKHASK